MIANVYGNPWIHMINQAILASPAPLVAPPAHTKGVCPPYSGPSDKTKAKRKAKAARS